MTAAAVICCALAAGIIACVYALMVGRANERRENRLRLLRENLAVAKRNLTDAKAKHNVSRIAFCNRCVRRLQKQIGDIERR